MSSHSKCCASPKEDERYFQYDTFPKRSDIPAILRGASSGRLECMRVDDVVHGIGSASQARGSWEIEMLARECGGAREFESGPRRLKLKLFDGYWLMRTKH